MSTRYATKVYAGLAAASIALLLTACAGGRSSAPPQRFDLGVDTSTPSIAPDAQPVLLAFDAGPNVGDHGMVWRVGNSAAPNAYADSRWAAPPGALVSQRLAERIAVRRPVSEAAVLTSAPQLRVTLTQFEQVFSEDGASSEGRVSLQVMLVQDRQVIGATRIYTQAPAPTQDASGGVEALRVATTQAGDALSTWLDRYLK